MDSVVGRSPALPCLRSRGRERGAGLRTCARDGGRSSVGDARSRLAGLRPENNGQREKRRDQGYLRVDENLLRDDTTAEKIAEGKTRPAAERRFKDKLARESSEFIWNSDWRKELETWERSSADAGDGTEASARSASAANSNPSSAAGPAPRAERGISFSRLAELNDLSVDLSEQLRPRPKNEGEADGGVDEGARRKDFLDFPGRVNGSGGGIDASSVRLPDPESAARAREQYAETKGELFVYTLLTGVATGGLCYNLYGQDIAISYGVGCLASLFYLRLLSRTVDSLASEDAAAQVGGAGGQARLLVPAILVLGYSKGNESVLENYGVQLNIIAILAGFFTYKAGTFGQVIKSTVTLLAADRRKEGG